MKNMDSSHFQPEETQKSLLLLSDKDFDNYVNVKQHLISGDFLTILNLPSTLDIFEQCSKPLEGKSIEETLREAVDSWLQSDNAVERQSQLLSIGIAALFSFIQDNWCGPNLDESLKWLKSYENDMQSDDDSSRDLFSNLVLDGESVVSVTRHPELLILARAVFQADFLDFPSALWWRFRCLLIHQNILEEKSPQLHEQLISLKDKLQQLDLIQNDSVLNILLQLEITQMHLFYHEVQQSKKALEIAVNAAGLSMTLTGALGKRTRYQLRDLAQLTLNVQSNEETAPPPQARSVLPKDVKLDDDVRLDKIAFSNSVDGEYSALSPLQQACVLGSFVQTQKCQPKDKLADEELMAYLSCLLARPQVWSFQISSLLFRSKIESNHSRTIERSMTQTQALVDSVNSPIPGPWERLPFIFCSHMSTRWCIEEELANLLISLGCVNSALDIYLRLHCWEQVIACYNHLQLRHKAEEIIRQELEKKESVKLWCLLGDATDNVEYYEKAWNLSNKKSARAQRHWGLYYFQRKQYAEAIPHLQESLAHNSLQTKLWFQLGYASLQHEKWDIAATAYRRCCFLDPENFEAWNNLSKAHVKLGQKNRAWKSLQEALKWDYENWRVWENFMIVSIDCAVMDEVIRSYHRILDLKGKHVDVEVLEILGKAILENLPDCDGVPCGGLLQKSLELLGRITALVTNDWKVWRLYSRLTSSLPSSTPETEARAVQHLQKALRSAVADASWVNDNALCHEVMDLSIELANVSLEYAKNHSHNSQASSILSSAKLSLKSTTTKLKQQRLNILTGQVEDEFLSKYTELESLLDQILQSLSVKGTS